MVHVRTAYNVCNVRCFASKLGLLCKCMCFSTIIIKTYILLEPLYSPRTTQTNRHVVPFFWVCVCVYGNFAIAAVGRSVRRGPMSMVIRGLSFSGTA